MDVRLRRPLVAQALLLVGLLGAFGFFDYDQLVQFKLISELCVLALFAWLALSVRFDSRWVMLVFLPAFGLLLFVLTYAYVFTLRVDSSLLPSILSQRNYVYVLLGPAVYLLYTRGWRLEDFQQIFLLAMIMAVLSLLVYDTVFASHSFLLSGQFFVLRLGEVAEQSSIYRVMNTSALFLLMYFGRRALQARDVVLLVFALGMAGISAAVLAIGLPRGLLASIVVAMVLYAAFLARPARATMSIALIPLGVLAVGIVFPYLSRVFVDRFGEDLSYRARVHEASSAWQSIKEYPLLGFGSDSAQTVSFQDLFGQFYPSDIGLLGVTFQFGLVGLVLYLLLVGWLCASMLGLVWAYAEKAPAAQSAFLWAMFIVCLSFLVASPLQARLLYGTGLPVGAFAWGLIMAHRRGPWASPSGKR
jgi:O-antigen ligase